MPQTPPPERLLQTLRSVFPKASDRSLVRLSADHTRRELPPGAVLPTRSVDPEVALLLSGRIAVIQTAADGRVASLGVFGPGVMVGLSTLDGEAAQVGLDVLEPAVVATWPGRRLRAVAERDPGMLVDVVDHLVYGIRYALTMLEKRSFATASARLASILLRHEDLVFSPAGPGISRGQLAALVGVSREMTGRIIRRWIQAGIISRRGLSGLRLNDRQRLIDEAGRAEDLAPARRQRQSRAS
jgi:CRP-like cAMP-binding protein